VLAFEVPTGTTHSTLRAFQMFQRLDGLGHRMNRFLSHQRAIGGDQ
jgi:hypothetical protein